MIVLVVTDVSMRSEEGAVVVVEISEGLFVVGVLRVFVGDAVVQAHPFVPVVVRPHAVVQHRSSLLHQLRQFPGCPGVPGVPFYVAHLQNYVLAHHCALNGCAAAVESVLLVLFDSLGNAVLHYLLRSGIL